MSLERVRHVVGRSPIAAPGGSIASATCVDRDDQFLMGVQAVVVPGRGVAACQAAVDGTHANWDAGL